MSAPRVSIVRRTGSTLDAVRQAVDLVGGIRSYVKRGDRVIIKPNLAYPYPPPATSDPSVVEAVALLCREAGAGEVGIGDSTSYSCKDIIGTGRWTNRDVIIRTGMDRVAERCGARIHDFDLEPWKRVRIPGGVVLKEVDIAAAMLEADVVINVPVMKTHFETLVTLSIKNFHGIISDHFKIQYHKDELNQKLVDLHTVVRTHLVVMDALVAMEGMGPRLGTPVAMNLILAGSDVVAVDAIASEVMGVRADEVETTRIAAFRGLGCGDVSRVEVQGCSLDSVRRCFARPDVRIDGLYEGVTIYRGGPCVHCYGRARIFLDTLKAGGLPKNGGVTALFVGVKPPCPGFYDLPGEVVFVGDCALEGCSNLRYALGKRAWCMEGCPPIPSLHRVIDGLTERSTRVNGGGGKT